MPALVASHLRIDKRLRLVWAAAWWLSTLAASAQSGLTATVAWEASTSADVAAYNVYYGTRSGDYTNVVLVDAIENTAAIIGLEAGTTYFFAVTALDSLNEESVFSDEVYFSTASPPKLLAQSWDDGYGNSFVTVTTPLMIPRGWELDSSTDLVNWSYLYEGYASTVDYTLLLFPDFVRSYPQMFFRVKLH